MLADQFCTPEQVIDVLNAQITAENAGKTKQNSLISAALWESQEGSDGGDQDDGDVTMGQNHQDEEQAAAQQASGAGHATHVRCGRSVRSSPRRSILVPFSSRE